MVRGWLVEIGASHQIRWNILREDNWGVPSAHIMFICILDTYIVHYLIVLWGCAHTGVYTLLKLHVRIIFPMISLKVFGVTFWLHWVEINKEK